MIAVRGIGPGIKEAMAFEMRREPSIFLMGVDENVGVWGHTRGLHEEFGDARVRTSPIAESTLVGAAVGAAAAGMRPVVDLHMSNFMYAAWDQIANQLTKLTYMSDGQLMLPVVLIAVAGSSTGNAGQHSDVPIAALAQLGQINVVYATTPEDASGLMTSALRSTSPTAFFYPIGLGAEKGAPHEVGSPVPFGTARVRRVGRDVTVWATGQMVRRAEVAAQTLESDGIDIEIIDPRTLWPLDLDTVLSSVRKTGRLLAVDEAPPACSCASEIIANVAMHGLELLTQPPVRLTRPPDVGVPYAPILETTVVPTIEDIAAACRELCAA